MRKVIPILVVGFLFSIACRNKKSETDVKISNGTETDAFKAVVLIEIELNNKTFRECTGVFVKHQLLITAASCIENAVSVKYNGFTASAIHVKNDIDLGWVKFGSNVSEHTLPVSVVALQNEEPVAMIGFGAASDSSAVGKKNFGLAFYRDSDQVKENEFIRIKGTIEENEQIIQGPAIGYGDIGGPLLANGKGIVGIASKNQSEDGKISYSLYTNLLSEKAADFIREIEGQPDLTPKFEIKRKVERFSIDQMVNVANTNGHQITKSGIGGKLDSDRRCRSQHKLTLDFRPSDYDAMKTLGIYDGIFGLSVSNIPDGAVTLQVFWDHGICLLQDYKLNGEKTFETDGSWEFGVNSTVFVTVLDKNDRIIGSGNFNGKKKHEGAVDYHQNCLK